MRWLFVSFLCLIARGLLSLRYKIEVRGKEELKRKLKGQRGILFLPNHPAHVDPIIIGVQLWPLFKTRPLVIEYVYQQSGIHLIMKLFKALSIPNFETSLNEIKIEKAERVLDEIANGLKKGDNFVFSPAGRLKYTGREVLGGVSGAHTLLNKFPAKVVLIRTVGLWGSSFSKAYSEKSPDLKTTLKKSFFYLLKSFIFFMPRRRVTVDFFMPEDLPVAASRLEFNRYLENWYNRYPTDHAIVDTEPLYRVSYSLWKEILLEPFQRADRRLEKRKRKLKNEAIALILKEISRLTSKPEGEIKEEDNLSSDLGFDSLDLAEMIAFLSKHFDVGQVYPNEIERVADLFDVAEGVKKKAIAKTVSSVSWPEEKRRKEPELPDADTIQMAFLKSCHRMKGSLATGDDLIGVLSYNKLKLAALLLSKEMAKIEGERIGILLPSLTAAYLSVFAILLAGKIPVMLNWTLGPRYLDEMIKISGLKKIVTSWKFLEKLSNVDLGQCSKMVSAIEDIKQKVSLKDKLYVLYLMTLSPDKLYKKLNLNLKSSDPAVILFTSGTEAAPKAVPLTHENILFDQKAALSCVKLKSSDILFGALPPFHSFGFSIVGIFPVLSGIKAVYFPDPTDNFAMAEEIKRWKATMICLAPTFLKGVLNAAKKEDLKTIRLFVVGAEKAPKELFERVGEFNGSLLLEGYGITECAPVITLTRPEDPPKGVGKPLPGISLAIMNLESGELVARGGEGEILVKGANVFPGYLNNPKDPFIILNKEKWYRTGDLGTIDAEGNLHLLGRLKRFTKVGAEMISLGAIEEILLGKLKEKGYEILEEGLPLAVCVRENGDKPLFILFTTVDIDVSNVNLLLKEAGFSTLVKISEVKNVEAIPLLGTGKVDYRKLQTLLV